VTLISSTSAAVACKDSFPKWLSTCRLAGVDPIHSLTLWYHLVCYYLM